MYRLAVQIAALALGASALGGCSMFGDDSASADGAKPVPVADTSPMAPDIDSNVHQAQLLRGSGDVMGATRIMSQLMLVYPDDPRVVGEYGKLLVQEKASADAVQFLRRAIELQPNDWSLYSALGVALDQQSQSNDAKLAYDRALALKPNEPAVLNNYAMSRMLAGDPAGARTLLLRAQASGSTDPKIASNLALLNRNSPVAPAAVMQAAPPTAVAAVTAPRKPVTRTAMAPVVVGGEPRPLMHGNSQVVMQDVPFDPLAGPVAKHTSKPTKTAKAAKAAKPVPRVAAAATKPTAKKLKPADQIPALRMTADAGKS
jgi:Flp pilus assembly protein TadD